MTNLLLTRIADSWGVGRPGRLFQIALIGSGRDPLLMRELIEAQQAMEKEKEEVANHDYQLLRNHSRRSSANPRNGTAFGANAAPSFVARLATSAFSESRF